MVSVLPQWQGLGAITVRWFRCYHSDKNSVLSQWQGLGAHTVTWMTNWRRSNKDDLIEGVYSLGCEGLGYLILFWIYWRKNSWLSFPLEWGFSLVVCLHLMSSSICWLALVLMIMKILIEWKNNNNKPSQYHVINKRSQLTCHLLGFLNIRAPSFGIFSCD